MATKIHPNGEAALGGYEHRDLSDYTCEYHDAVLEALKELYDINDLGSKSQALIATAENNVEEARRITAELREQLSQAQWAIREANREMYDDAD